MTTTNFWGQSPITTTVQVSPAPTTTTFTLTDASDFLVGQYIFVQVDGERERTQITGKTGNALTVSPALSTFPDVPGEAQSGRELITNGRLNASGLFNVDSTAELAAIDTTLASDGLKYQIKNVGIYRFAFASSAIADNFMVIEPASGPGRWLLEATGNLWQIEANGPSSGADMSPPAEGVSWGSMFQRNQLQKLELDTLHDGGYLFNTISERPQIYIGGRWYTFMLERSDYDLSGTITNTLSGSNESGVTITIDDTSQQGTTAGSGTYAISDVPKGTTVALTATKTGYNTYTGTVNLSSGNAVKNFTIARRTISGSVTSSLDSSSLSDVTVEIASLPRSTSTNGSGAYGLIDVPDGSYTLAASKSGYVSYSSSLTVAGDGTRNIVLTPITWTVSGTITSSLTGNTIQNATVTVGTRPAVSTNSSGNYSRDTVPDGSHSFNVVKEGYFSDHNSSVVISGNDLTKSITMSPVERTIQSGGFFSPNGDNTYTYGYSFYTSKILRVTQIGFYNVDSYWHQYRLKLWDSGGTALIAQDVTGPSAVGWTYATITPVTIYPGTYILSGMLINTGGTIKVPYGSGVFDHDAVTALSDYQSGGDTRPTGAAGSVRGWNIKVEM
jgi:hypothetical protein